MSEEKSLRDNCVNECRKNNICPKCLYCISFFLKLYVSESNIYIFNVKLKLFVRIRQQTIFSCVYEFIVTSGQLFPVHGELNNTVLK